MSDQHWQYPNLNPGERATIVNNTQDTPSSVVDSMANGPIADKARTEADNTKNEFSNLAASRQTPKEQAATGQALTHYHSFFYNLLSWEHPRATGITYGTIVALIFVLRYVPVFRYTLRALYLLLGLTAGAEVVGKLSIGQGLASKMRPRRYYTIPRETLESVLADVEELINFFVIEFQRIVFAENVFKTVGAFSTAFLTYWLVKIMPAWGLTLFFTTVAFFVPLTYLHNREVIDQSLADAQKLVNDQTTQIRDLAAQHTNKAVEMSQNTFSEYSAKAQELIGQTKKTAVEKDIVSPQTAEKVAPEKDISGSHFPSAPTSEPAVKSEPILA